MSKPVSTKSWKDVDPEVRRFITPALFHWPHLATKHLHLAAILFVDVAGFTALSESLMSYGPEGAEILDRTIAEYFDGLLDIAELHGGVPLKISGDAITLLFLSEDGQLDETIKRAVACSAVMGAYTPKDTRAAALAHKIGVGAGELITGLVGDASIRREFVYDGPALLDAVNAEHQACAGEVWLSHRVTQALGEETDTILHPTHKASAPQRLKGDALQEIQLRLSSSVQDYLLPEQEDASQFMPLLPQAVVAHAKGSTLEYLCRHQIISVLFAGCPKLALKSPEDIAILDQHYRAMAQIVDRHGGFLSEFEGGDKGSKLIIFFGAPITLEESARNAARCAWAMQDHARRLQTVEDQRIGLSTGRLYVGRIGCRSLLKYSALGDRMNLAARLMGLSKTWEVLAESSSVEKSRSVALWGASKTLQVKGKTQLVTVNELAGLRQSNRENRRGIGLIGRETEKRIAEDKVVQLLQNKGALIDVIGKAGIGKTRLAMAIWRIATMQHHIESFLWRGQEAERSSGPMAPWRPVLCSIMGLDDNASPEERQGQFDAWLAAQPESIRIGASLLGPLLDVEAPTHSAHAGLKDEHRLKLQQQALSDAILSDAEKPKVVIIEQAGQLDSQTQASILELAPQLKHIPLMIVLLRRPALEQDPFQKLKECEEYRSLHLKPLTHGQCDALAMNRLKVSQLDSELSNLLITRCEGNPLQLEAWIDVLRDTGRIAVKFGTAILQGDNAQALPDRLEALILTRLERLPADAQTTLRIASVCQQAFTPQDILDLHPKTNRLKAIESHLALGARAGLLYYDRDRRPWMYFSRVEFREALHNSLPYQIRRKHHARRIKGLLAKAPTPLDDESIILLAQHHKHVPDAKNQSKFFTLAYQVFQKRNEARQVLHWSQLAIKVHKKCQDIKAQCEGLNALTHALGAVGENDERIARLTELITVADGHRPEFQVSAHCILGRLYARKGDIDQATSHLDEAKTVAYAAEESTLVLQTCNAAATIYGELGQGAKCKEAAQEALQHTNLDTPSTESAYAYANMGLAANILGHPRDALKAFTQAQSILETCGDRWNLSVVLGNIGIELWAMGQPEEGHKRLIRAHELKTKMGFRREIALGLLNVGFSHYRLGNIEEAEKSTQDALALFRRLGYDRGRIICLTNLSEMAWISGRIDEAMEQLDALEATLDTQRNTAAAVDVHLLRGEIHLEEGNFGLAQGCFEEVIKLTGANESTKHIIAEEGLGVALVGRNKLEEGFDKLQYTTECVERKKMDLDYPQRLWWRAYQSALRLGEMELAETWAQKSVDVLQAFLSQVHDPKTREKVIATYSWNRMIWRYHERKEARRAAKSSG